jgi:hypothetical protein
VTGAPASIPRSRSEDTMKIITTDREHRAELGVPEIGTSTWEGK